MELKAIFLAWWLLKSVAHIKYVENANQAELISLKKTVLKHAVTTVDSDIIKPNKTFSEL